MKIYYVIYNNWNKDQQKILSKYGINVNIGMDRFDIEEGKIFFEIEKKLNSWGVQKSVATLYDKRDIEESDYLVYVSVWENGYPQPESVLGYLERTYDLSKYCKSCGSGATQKEPFRVKSSPKWGKKKMFELIWVQDEIFVRRDLYEEVFAKLGIECCQVLLHKNDNIIEDTVQLKIPVSSSFVLHDTLQFETCLNCKQKKFSPNLKGYFPSFLKPIGHTTHIIKTIEYFGSSAAADKRIIISKDLYESLLKFGCKPTVWPVR